MVKSMQPPWLTQYLVARTFILEGAGALSMLWGYREREKKVFWSRERVSGTCRRRGNTGSYGLLSDTGIMYLYDETKCRSTVRGRKTLSFGNDGQVLQKGQRGFQKVMRTLLEPRL